MILNAHEGRSRNRQQSAFVAVFVALFRRLVLSIAAFAALVSVPLAGQAHTVTLNPGVETTEVHSITGFTPGTSIVTDTPSTVPSSGSPIATASGITASTSYSLSPLAFIIDFDHSVPDVHGYFSESVASIYFSVDENVGYRISGSYTAVDPIGKEVQLIVRLQQVGSGDLFSNDQFSRSTPTENFMVEGIGGDDSNSLLGSSMGTLVAGVEYRLAVLARIQNTPVGPPFTASGSVTLSLGPDPVFDTATDFDPFDGGAHTVNDDFWLLHRFEITNTTTLGTVGGQFTNNCPVASITVFAALVSLSDSTDLPDSIDLTTPDLLDTALISIPQGAQFSGVSEIPLNITLTPGWYGLVFGTGAFGAPSSGTCMGLARHATDLDPSQLLVLMNQSTGVIHTNFGIVLRFLGTEAPPIHESASLGPVPADPSVNTVGVGVSSFLGSRFSISETVRVTEIGGHFRPLNCEPSCGSIFGAIISLESANGLPSGSPFNATTVATTVFSPFPSLTEDIHTPLSVTLSPGDYALIFGSGEFGASGSGGMPRSNNDIPGQASYFHWQGASSSWNEGGFSDARFVVLGSNSPPPGQTDPGMDVVVSPPAVDENGDPIGDSPITFEFDEVTGGGETTVTVTETGPPPPDGFKVGQPPTYFDLETTATFTGSVEVCIDYSEISFGNEANLRLFHEEAGIFVDVTSFLDTVDDIICGVVNSFSFFLVAESETEPPVVSLAAATPNPSPINTSILVTALIDDSTTGGSAITSASYTVDGGGAFGMGASDGLFDTATEAVEGLIAGFSEAGVHEVCVSGVDQAGNTSNQDCILLAVFDPSAGFVTGGGWIDSPPGAYTPENPNDPDILGKANFGFVSKYKKGAQVPEGQTEFRFQAASLNFHSTSYDWLVLAGTRAQFKGDGSINGVEGFGFLLTAIDDETDRFRIKIWNVALDEVVYDNKAGFSDTSDDTTVLGGGNIVIKKK